MFSGDDLALDAAVSEARADDDACHSGQFVGHVVAGDLLAVDEMQARLHIVVDAGQNQALADTFVGVLQVVFSHQTDMYFALGVTLFVQEIVP